ncbi:23S rRNA (pseudouridine(1915)-N(3))-methyltransferase RlmH [Methanocalculus taiwanensis]|uniref:Putative ribosomal RNA large subunit methyltransferase H n=1 Tax=Methanocalculus taiwanensis TaxID=106207 RepID=A0ABD4TFM4_9EURY|nr:23S rRNA (pseudouridine(1915)-N(3))-methyltransferase RlmH [Methanocalculus taiwanensis]MCQ1537778.1 23S rRNA (pseudouridine(1915)-N(3))-methyltransferase RlmH [Methanocalculus taiwanensis]
MQIRIIAVGKVKENWQKEGIADLIRRLSPYATITITEVPDQKYSSAGEQPSAIRKEGASLLAAAKDPALFIALDPAGRMMPSETFAALLRNHEISGRGDIAFCIGGADGLSEEVRARADLILSLSEMTFTHTMARLLLLEQVYRGFRIIRGEPYHR